MKTLERRLGVGSVIAISIGAMLGSGLFVLPGIAASYAGPSVFLAYLAAGIFVIPAALSKAELATAMPESGGTYVYIDRTFGPMVGTVMGLGLWLSLLLKSAFALVGFGAYLMVLSPVPIKPVALALCLGVVALNVRGVRKVGRVQSWIVIIVLFSLTTLVVFGSLTYQGERLEPLFPHGTGGFWFAVSFVYISYAGVTKVAAIAEEVEDPGRNLPIGILASLLLVTALYTTVTLV
ncbi:MAG: amino acid permease, partial [Myxococcales bacterium]|nr:amino acid permease [Myxococcales bacterium]